MTNQKQYSLINPPFFSDLAESKNILIAGCGGGYDVYAGLPIYFALKTMNKQVHLANLTFSEFNNVDLTSTKKICDDCLEINADTKYVKDDPYFPELYLSQWFRSEFGEDVPVYMFRQCVYSSLTDAYKELVKHKNIDTIILVDGGTDALMKGNEESLGTPHEDLLSIAAVDNINIEKKYLVCIGFGIDAFHGVCHKHFLENVSELIRQDAFLGTFSVIKQMPEAILYKKACEYAFNKMEVSLVNGAILSAIDGEYGDYHFSERTKGSEQWTNSLMTMYWCFKLSMVANNLVSIVDIKATKNFWQLTGAIYSSDVRTNAPIRKSEKIPL